MADKKISQLTAATTPLAGTEVLPIVQGGSTVKVSAANITAGRAVSAASLSVDGAAVINESGADADFRVEGDGQTHCLFVDASTDRIGINQSAPSGKLHITGTSASYIFNNSCTEFYNNNPDQIKTYASNAAGWLTYGAGGREDDLRITTAGNIEAKIGNFSVLTAGKGIDFSANTGAAGETSSLLDWYEEGTWTPVLTCTTPPTTPFVVDVVSATYTRIGRQVTVTARIRTTSVDITGADNFVIITGLPFTAATPGVVTITGASDWGDDYPSTGLIIATTTQINLFYRATSDGADENLLYTDISTAAGTKNNIYFTGTYFV